MMRQVLAYRFGRTQIHYPVTSGTAEGDWLVDRTSGWVCAWDEYLLAPDDAELAMRMRRAENTGRPLGDEGFVKKVGGLLGRNLLPGKPGRPRKEGQASKKIHGGK